MTTVDKLHIPWDGFHRKAYAEAASDRWKACGSSSSTPHRWPWILSQSPDWPQSYQVRVSCNRTRRRPAKRTTSVSIPYHSSPTCTACRRSRCLLCCLSSRPPPPVAPLPTAHLLLRHLTAGSAYWDHSGCTRCSLGDAAGWSIGGSDLLWPRLKSSQAGWGSCPRQVETQQKECMSNHRDSSRR